jgi:hypothetical protein
MNIKYITFSIARRIKIYPNWEFWLVYHLATLSQMSFSASARQVNDALVFFNMEYAFWKLKNAGANVMILKNSFCLATQITFICARKQRHNGMDSRKSTFFHRQ